MCELLGMSASVPTDICFSFAGLIKRGGTTGPHKDGWGIAFYDGKGCRTFHDPAASAQSPIADFLRKHSIKSEIVISHIGQLRGAKKLPLGLYRPIGTTDSEHAFCWLLGRLRDRWERAPADRRLEAAIAELAVELGEMGVFNMLLSNSRSLFCFRSTNLV